MLKEHSKKGRTNTEFHGGNLCVTLVLTPAFLCGSSSSLIRFIILHNRTASIFLVLQVK
jgi:hypothetical protein